MTMKKLLSLLMAVILTVTPMAVLAENADLGTYENPYLLYADSLTPLPITVAPGTEAYVKVDQCDNSIVTVGHATSDGYFLQYGRQTVLASSDGTAQLMLNTFSDIFSVYNSGDADVVVYLSLAAGEPSPVGSMDNPDTFVFEKDWYGNWKFGSPTLRFEEGNQGYYYTWTADTDGMVEFNFYSSHSGWMACVNNITAGIYGEYRYSDDELGVSETVAVSAGDEIQLFLTTYDEGGSFIAPEGSIYFFAYFGQTGFEQFPEKLQEMDYSREFEADSDGYWYIYTAEKAGTLTFTFTSEIWGYEAQVYNVDRFYQDQGSYDFDYGNVHSFELDEGGHVKIMISTYTDAIWIEEILAATVTWSVSFTPDELEDPEAPPTGSEKEDGYWQSDLYLSVGDDVYMLDENYQYTVYYFEPSEAGKYTFTASNGLIAIVSYNGMWVTTEPTAETVTENTFVWECNSVGQSIMVAAISEQKGISIYIEKEELVIVEIPWTVYENKVTPVPFTFEGDEDALLYVDTFDGVCDVAVLGADGYYHLGSANGPLLYACLSDSLMSLAGAMEYGQLKDVIYDGDTVVQKIDFNEAFGEYLACTDDSAMYPLTEDLMIIFQSVGGYQGWYGEDGWIGGDLDDAWMFACYYFEQEEPAFVFGDVDGDGKAAKTDYFKLKSYLLGKDIVFDDGMIARSDIDGNGKVNKTDYFKLKSYLLGKWTPEN